MPRTEETNQLIREQRRQQILQAALKVFAYRGLAATRIADIASEADMSQGLIYRYYTSKEEVFAVLVECTLDLMLGLAKEAQVQTGNALDKLAWLTAQMLPYSYEQPEGALVIVYALTNTAVPTEVKEVALRYTKMILDIVEQLIVVGQASGDIITHDSTQLALLYMATLNGLATGASCLPRPNRGFPDVHTVIQFLRPSCP
jgi:AcrR family transcriptional regulator